MGTEHKRQGNQDEEPQQNQSEQSPPEHLRRHADEARQSGQRSFDDIHDDMDDRR